MLRMIAFVLALCACAGLVSGAHGAVTELRNQVEFTQNIHYGDPAILEGQQIDLTITCGEHMTWYSNLTLGEQVSSVTEFEFSQKGRETAYSSGWSNFEISYLNNISVGSSGQDLPASSSNPYVQMVRDVSALTDNGEELSISLPASDYMDYYPLDISMEYASDQYYFSGIYVGSDNEIIGTHGYGDSDPQDVFPAYAFLSDSFRFPVQPEHIYDITIRKNYSGAITDISIFSNGGPVISSNSVLTDRGIYFTVVFQTESGTPLAGAEYPQGCGIYFLPWKESTGNVQVNNNTSQMVTPDTDALELIHPLEDGDTVYLMEYSQEDNRIWLLGLEDNFYTLTVIDADSGEVLQQLALQDSAYYTGKGDAWYYPCAAWDEELMCIALEETLVVLRHDGLFEIVMEAPYDDQISQLPARYAQATGDMKFDGEKFIIADTGYTYRSNISVEVFTEAGLQFRADYNNSLSKANDYGHSGNNYISLTDYPLMLK